MVLVRRLTSRPINRPVVAMQRLPTTEQYNPTTGLAGPDCGFGITLIDHH